MEIVLVTEKPLTLKAIKVGVSTEEAIVEFFGKKTYVIEAKGIIVGRLYGGKTLIKNGSWIVCDINGCLQWFSDDEFYKRYLIN
jgi:hypothetical protein